MYIFFHVRLVQIDCLYLKPHLFLLYSWTVNIASIMFEENSLYKV